MCKKNRIIVFLGAGFPRPWGAPSSTDLYNTVAEEIKKSSLSFLTELIPESFEDLIAALYSYSVYPLNPFQQSLFQASIPKECNLDEAIVLYRECINKVMAAVHAYEVNLSHSSNKERNNNLRSLFRLLHAKYRHVSVYTTNYDEMLPQVLGWSDNTMSIDGERFAYKPLNQHQLKHSYSNLHGSVHIEMTQFGGQQYEVTHNPLIRPLLHMHELYGGNPSEFGLFTPIIVGHSKAQQILSKHYNYLTTCFANDLSDCNTFLAIGNSFSDSHINAIIRQYTYRNSVSFRIVTLRDDVICSSPLDMKVTSEVFGDKGRYHPDSSKDCCFIRDNGRLVYYKFGTESFLEDKEFQKRYL